MVVRDDVLMFDAGITRETYLASQLWVAHQLSKPVKGALVADGKWLFEVWRNSKTDFATLQNPCVRVLFVGGSSCLFFAGFTLLPWGVPIR